MRNLCCIMKLKPGLFSHLWTNAEPGLLEESITDEKLLKEISPHKGIHNHMHLHACTIDTLNCNQMP